MYYSQCGEDKFLNENFFKGKTNGVYIEMGAVDGLFQSNTKFFEDQLNWTGILIEQQPNSFKKLQMNRPNNLLYNDLISNETNIQEFMYIVGKEAVGGVKNTLSQYHMDTFYKKE